MFTCKGTATGMSAPHSHEFAFEAKVCYGIAGFAPAGTSLTAPTPVVTATPTAPPPFRFGHRAAPRGPLSEPQYKFIGDLGGDKVYAKSLTYEQASTYIGRLQNAKKAAVSTPTVTDPRLPMIESLLAAVPEGYYAVGDKPERFESLTFIRFSKPVKGRFAGTWKFQQIKGTGLGYRLEEYAMRFRSGAWSWSGGVYRSNAVIESLMLICADHQTAALLYAQHIGRCCRCNATLTDERSRYYGIGPECEKHWPSHMEQVEATKGPWH